MRKCDKKKFKVDEAKRVVENAKLERDGGNNERREKRYYFCMSCQSYHVTSISQAKMAKIESKFIEKRQRRINNIAKSWCDKNGWNCE